MKTYLAIVGKTSGYVLDAYPDEQLRDRRYYGNKIIGEFTTRVEAEKAVYDAIKKKCEELNLKHWWD